MSKETDELRLIVALEDIPRESKAECLRLLSLVDADLVRLRGSYETMAHQMIASGVPEFALFGRKILDRIA